jgi:hypothetical protein
MTNNRFTSACLTLIVLLLGISTYNQGIRTVRAAQPAEYLVEGNSGQEASVLNTHMKRRVAEGWTLHTFGSTFLVWQK